MKIRVLFNLLLIVITASVGCGNEPPERERLAKEAMIIHDEIMPQMDTIIELSIALSEVRENLEGDSLRLDDLNRVRQALELLDKADEGMMSWMHRMGQYQAELDNYTDEEAVAYLKAEKERILGVQELMERSINTGGELLLELQPTLSVDQPAD
jgi:hypothetical protein